MQFAEHGRLARLTLWVVQEIQERVGMLGAVGAYAARVSHQV